MLKNIILYLSLSLLLLSCGGGSQQAKNEGSGSEIVGVTETTSAESTRHASRGTISVDTAMIFLIPFDHEADGSFVENMRTRSNADGSFAIDYAEPGRYILEAVDSTATGYKSRVTAVSVTGDGERIDVGILDLKVPGSVKCHVTIPSWISKLGSVKYELFVLGTRIKSEGDENSITVNLSNIPLGTPLTLKAVMKEPISVSATKEISTIISGNSVDVNIDASDWL